MGNQGASLFPWNEGKGRSVNPHMYQVLQIVTLLLVSISMAMSLAHALELPGKLRLPKDDYLAVQAIYYPGFTIGGMIGEAGGLIATLALLCLTPGGSLAFWLTFAAFACLLAMHAAYWILTHPVNDFWLRETKPQGLGGRFFSLDPLGRTPAGAGADWVALRGRWEYSHVLRAGLAMLGFLLLIVAVVLKH